MKLSELQKILKEYQDKYDDLEVKTYDVYLDKTFDFLRSNISVTSTDDDNPTKIEYITIWA